MGSSKKIAVPLPRVAFWNSKCMGGFFGLEFQMQGGGLLGLEFRMHEGVSRPGIPKGRGLKTLIY